MIRKAAFIGVATITLAACQDLTSGADNHPRTYYFPAENSLEQVRLDVETLGMCGDELPMNFSEPEIRGGRGKVTFDCR